MSLDYSIAQLVNRLADWSKFPKYSLERRIDIFLTPFIEGFIGNRLNGQARLIAPEFPLPADLRIAPLQLDETAPSARTVNVDYLLHIARGGLGVSAWVFLELKTDASSFDREQLALYECAARRTMPVLIRDIEQVQRATAERHREKYAKLRAAVAAVDRIEDPIEIAYLSPEPRDGFPRSNPGKPPINCFTLGEFAEQRVEEIPPEHRDLWPYVRDLLRLVNAGGHVRGPA